MGLSTLDHLCHPVCPLVLPTVNIPEKLKGLELVGRHQNIMSENNNQWWFRIQQTNCILFRGVLLQDPCTLPLLFCRIYPCYIKECLGLHSVAGGFQSAHGKTKSVKQACIRKDGRLWPAGVQVLSLL
jgi:hypothetical protein